MQPGTCWRYLQDKNIKMQEIIKRKWWYTLCSVLLFCLSCAVILAVSSGYTKKLSEPWSTIIPASCSVVGALGFTLLFARWERLKLSNTGVVPGKRSALHFAAGFIIGLFLVVLQISLLLIASHIQLFRTTGINMGAILISLIIYLLLAVREELAFRGYPLRSLNRTIGLWGAQIIIALVFAAEHVIGGMSWWQALLGAGTGSILFGMAAITTKGLAAPIGLHAAWNFGQWIFGFKEGAGIWHAVVDKGYNFRVELAGMITYLLVIGSAIVAFYYYGRKQKIIVANR
jgi:uncharacterized protein